jgi:hypothetical protein
MDLLENSMAVALTPEAYKKATEQIKQWDLHEAVAKRLAEKVIADGNTPAEQVPSEETPFRPGVLGRHAVALLCNHEDAVMAAGLAAALLVSCAIGAGTSVAFHAAASSVTRDQQIIQFGRIFSGAVGMIGSSQLCLLAHELLRYKAGNYLEKYARALPSAEPK